MLVATIQQLRDQLEVDVLKKERSLRALYEEKMKTMQGELDAARANVREKEMESKEVSALRDEVDLLRPLAEKLAKVESQVARYKVKIDELSGAKESLRCAEVANADLMEKNMILERELAKAATWQRKLKESKEANTAVEFRVAELETLLARERQEYMKVCSEFEGSKSALLELQSLNTQLEGSVQTLLTAGEGDDAFSPGPAMAGGISEFNPELMHKVSRLEFENAQLKTQLSSETSARIDSLQDDVEDLTRLKSSFEKKYFDTEQDLRATQATLSDTKRELEQKSAEFQETVQQLRERQSLLEEDVTSQCSQRQMLCQKRDRLQVELKHAKEHQEGLARTLDTRNGEVAQLHEANMTLNCRINRLVSRCECVSMENEDLITKLKFTEDQCAATMAMQRELSAMQMEDANAAQLRLRTQRNRELHDITQQYEGRLADTLSRMTRLIDVKSTEMEQLKANLQQEKLQHDNYRHEVEATARKAESDLEAYKQAHSVSNAEWLAKETALESQLGGLEKRLSQASEQEKTLKGTVKNQLQSNKRLVAANQALKAEAVKKDAKIDQLENATTVLESKVVSLEKELAHRISQEKRKRDVKDEASRVSSQLNTQMGLMASELESVLAENKELLHKLVGCHCGREPSPLKGLHDSGQKAKNFYVSRIQQLEHDKEMVEHKRREVLLVNAKLIQEQKQLQVRNGSLSAEVDKLKESVNHWLLRDERHRQRASLEGESALESTPRSLPSSATKHHPNPSTIPRSSASTPSSSKKRKLDEPSSEFTDARAFFAAHSEPSPPRSKGRKRRLTHFISRVASDQQPETPSECHQQ